MKYIKHPNLKSQSRNYVNFDEEGNVKAKYRIHNYQITSCQNSTVRYIIVDIGSWDGSSSHHQLQLNPNITKQFGLNESGHIIYQLKSQCQLCNPGFFKCKITSSCCDM